MSEQAAVEQVGAEVAPEDLEQQQGDQPGDGDTEGQQATGEPAAQDEGTDEVTITLGDDSPSPEDSEAEKAPEWVRELRKSKREADKRIRELEAKLTESGKPAGALGEKPKLADFGYDEDAYAPALEKWVQAKAQADAEANSQRQAQEQMQQAYQARHTAYKAAAQALRVPDFEDAEAQASEAFNVMQQGIIINGADKPAELMYALGRNPAKAKELAAIADPIKFAFALSKLESQMKIAPRKVPPPAERRVSGSVAVAGHADGELGRLRADAEKTGDYSKVTAYKRQKAKQAA